MTYVFAGLAVTDFAAAEAWYTRLFGPPTRYPEPNEAVWHLSQTGLVYVVADPPRAGHGLLAVAVDDLDRLLAELSARGLVTEPAELGAVVLRDPDGNSIKLFQDPGRPRA
jgi:catechol 2,3-dioxygenase-like lactoylglutathione lyase family enzyme